MPLLTHDVDAGLTHDVDVGLTHDVEGGWTAGRGALRVDCLALVVPPRVPTHLCRKWSEQEVLEQDHLLQNQ